MIATSRLEEGWVNHGLVSFWRCLSLCCRDLGIGSLSFLSGPLPAVSEQFGITAPTIEELHAIAQGDQTTDRERKFHVTLSDQNARPLENNYSIDQLACILQLWCEDHQQDLVLSCLMSVGLVNLYDNNHTYHGRYGYCMDLQFQ